ncbi:hypothetical protein [Vibrio sp. CB1-14]|jgi:hypothetical protein|uniref:Uncharacterized protein n=1 Tax=Vibrio chaetopteri TaxID=3016528 RepID=A0AAU8BRE2_9VIBR
MNLDIKILSKGDSVMNVMPFGASIAIAVKKKNGKVEIVLLDRNDENIPEITATWTISEGEGEIGVSSSDNDVKITTF